MNRRDEVWIGLAGCGRSRMMPPGRPPLDWSRVVFTEHMPEAAAVEAQCQVVLDFGAPERACYEITVLRTLKGSGTQPFVALGRNRDDPAGFARGDSSCGTPDRHRQGTPACARTRSLRE